MVYGLGVLQVSAMVPLCRSGLVHSRLFDPAGRKLKITDDRSL